MAVLVTAIRVFLCLAIRRG